MYTGFWCGNLTERDHLEEPVVDGRIINKNILKKLYVIVRTLWAKLKHFNVKTGGTHNYH
jgi:hypothetical protein